MAAPVVQFTGEKELRLKLTGVAKAIASNKVLMGQIGAFLETGILLRTAEGKDADGKMFLPYSPLYRAFRESEGRPTNVVDLNFDGDMLAALTYDASNDGVVLYFMPTEDPDGGVTDAEKAYYNQQTREFFAMSAEDITEIEAMVNTYVKKHMDKKGF